MARHVSSPVLVLAAALLLATPIHASNGTPAQAPGSAGWWNGWSMNGWSMDGDLTLGGRATTGDTGSDKFNEYKTDKPGFWTRGLLRFESPDKSYWLHTGIGFHQENDQTWRINGGRYGLWNLELDAKRFAHRFGENAITAYSRGNDGNLALPSGWVRSAAALPTNAATFQSRPDLEIDIWDAKAGGSWRISDAFELTADYRILSKHGQRPGSVGLFFNNPNYFNHPKPVNEKTQQFQAALNGKLLGVDLRLDYLGSFFDNHFDDGIMVDNPLAGVDAFGTPARVRYSQMPDNQAHNFTLTGSRAFKVPFPVRMSGSVAYGRRLQNDHFLPFTSNSALPNAPLPAQSLNGRVNTWMANFFVTARPARRVNVDLRYRFYDFDNRTEKLTIKAGQRIEDDSLIDGSAHITAPNDYRRQNADLNATWRLPSGLKLKGGAGWENWKRASTREVGLLNEWKGRARLDWRANSWLWTQLRYDFGYRVGNRYDNIPGEFVDQRKFDLADRLRHEASLLVQLDPRPDLGFTFNAGFRDLNYNHSRYGALDTRSWFAGGDVGWQPDERVGVRAWYTFEWGRSYQRSRNRGPGLPDTSAFDWRSRIGDSSQTGGVDVDLAIIPEKLTAKLSYLITDSFSETDTTGDLGAAVDFPNIDNLRQVTKALLEYQISENLSVNFQYRYEKGNFNDFQTDPLGLVRPGRTDLYLNQAIDDYHAHIFEWGITFYFGGAKNRSAVSQRDL